MKRGRKSLSSSLEHGLSSYALAASAAGVNLLALVPPCEAKIVYTSSHHVIPPGHTCRLDLNHDGETDFAIQNRIVSTGTFSHDVLSAAPFDKNGVEGRTFAYVLHRGALIGAKKPFSAQLMTTCTLDNICSGPWLDAKGAYLGLKFHVNGEVHYGWARFNLTTSDGEITATLTGYAYETTPNKPIIAGKTHGKDVITVEPATLGHLALGSPALSTWRRKP